MWGVNHDNSSPHHPQSNGHAKTCVQQVKQLIMKTTTNGNLDDEDFDRGLLEICNTPRPDGRSPAQILLGRPLRTAMLAHSSFAPEWQDVADDCDGRQLTLKQKSEQYYNHSVRSLAPLRVGAAVHIQDHVSKRWDKVGTVFGVGRHSDYHMKLPSGRLCWRNRFLQPHHSSAYDTTKSMDIPEASPTPQTPEPSKRQVCFSLPLEAPSCQTHCHRRCPDRLDL
ncbi:uncharacterized protein LOC121878675 [Homarus americanus]|uniref:uncharacterized protein LOC121878675 n=1 Tax=Homarus americanus TaxID=6706 RepID=UPI001C4754E3|nr:uncharacterized protein LOC121878675 [Homarus americanus]